MAIVVPTITAENAHVYREQVERVQGFAQRIHIDLMDGVFTPNKSVETERVWWPEQIRVDIHLMFQNPESEIEQLIKLKPDLVIIPAESECDVISLASRLSQSDIKCGVALLQSTSVAEVEPMLSHIQHVLIFSGNLGHQGGSHADLSLLEKVTELRRINPELEIAWDGGVSNENIVSLASGGVDVINTGGCIQKSENPELAFDTLNALLA